jgi:hypothetical protein
MSQIYWGVMPNNKMHYAGLWWQHQQYESNFDLADNTEEWFNTIELRTRLNISPRLQVLAILPYQYHLRSTEGRLNTISGLGDMTLMGSYPLLRSKDSLGVKLRHQLRFGAGLKAPTGSFRAIGETASINPNFQVGSGSWDALFNLSYMARLNDFGVNVDATYKLNSANANDYSFGDRLNGALNFFYFQNLGKIEIMPALGLFYEQADWDVQKNYYRTHTGGHALFTTLGLESYFGIYNLGLNYMYPIQAEWSNGSLNPEGRLSIHLNVFF